MAREGGVPDGPVVGVGNRAGYAPPRRRSSFIFATSALELA
jgi:hypothetical protein